MEMLGLPPLPASLCLCLSALSCQGEEVAEDKRKTPPKPCFVTPINTPYGFVAPTLLL